MSASLQNICGRTIGRGMGRESFRELGRESLKHFLSFLLWPVVSKVYKGRKPSEGQFTEDWKYSLPMPPSVGSRLVRVTHDELIAVPK